jgi:arginine/lysine/ornithine decarboxylase
LLVDEAHGSHLIFGTYRGAGAAHAAAWVHGSHKTLGSLTQTGMLHLGMGVPEEPYALCLERIDSTSRSYPLLASLDLARQWAARHGRDAWENAAGRMDGLRRILSGAGLTILDESRLPADASPDPAKLTVAAPAGGFHAAGKLLRDHGLQCEAAGPDWLCLLVTPFHTDEELERLVPALTDAIAPTREGRGCCAGWPERLPVRVFWPREAVLRPRRRMALTAAENMVAADPLCPYPPGIPLVWPGEIIDRDTVEYVKAFLAAGGTVTGVDAAGEAAVVAEV